MMTYSYHIEFVVHCQDCQLAGKAQDGSLYCNKRKNISFKVKPHDFCSYGLIKKNITGSPKMQPACGGPLELNRASYLINILEERK